MAYVVLIVIMKHRKNELCGNEGMSSKQAETVRGLVRKDFRKIAPNGFGIPIMLILMV